THLWRLLLQVGVLAGEAPRLSGRTELRVDAPVWPHVVRQRLVEGQELAGLAVLEERLQASAVLCALHMVGQVPDGRLTRGLLVIARQLDRAQVARHRGHVEALGCDGRSLLGRWRNAGAVQELPLLLPRAPVDLLSC